MTAQLNDRAFTLASAVLLLAITAGDVWLALDGRWIDAGVVAALAVVAAAFMALRSRLPSIFSLLFLLAGLVNALGYIFDWWQDPIWFDEFAHFFTSLTLTAGVGWLMVARTRLDARRAFFGVVAAVTGAGIVIGVLWELFEWAVGIINSPTDTALDLVFDTIGALGAGLFCAWAMRRWG